MNWVLSGSKFKALVPPERQLPSTWLTSPPPPVPLSPHSSPTYVGSVPPPHTGVLTEALGEEGTSRARGSAGWGGFMPQPIYVRVKKNIDDIGGDG